MKTIINVSKVIFAFIGVGYLLAALFLGTWVLLDLLRINFHTPVVSSVTAPEGK